MENADLLVIGAGVVGLATAWQFQNRRPGAKVVVLDKEARVAAHQTGRNSGVIHSGIYYKPGSAKARTCRRGKAMLEEFCRTHGVAFERCGKVIVATAESELPRLATLEERARQNGVECARIGPERLREVEPHAAGIAALHVPETGIVDYVGMCEALAREIRERGGQVVLGARATSARATQDGRVVVTSKGEFAAKRIVNCAGLHSDRVTHALGATRTARVVPFRGEYFTLAPAALHLVKHLIYPVPDPTFPFLGVHFTRLVLGGVECGPNAVLALAREGYDWSTIDASDLWDVVSYGGFWKFASRHWRTGFGEVHRSFSRAAFTTALQRLVPEIRVEHLVRAEAGVRAQALLPDGALVDDFLVVAHDRVVNVLNAPSPAATASLAIGDEVVDRALEIEPR